jgi:hypothetical protein
MYLKKINMSLPVAHVYNPTYLGSRDQEDHGLKPAWANTSVIPYLEKTHHEKGLVECLKVYALSSIPGTSNKKKINTHMCQECVNRDIYHSAVCIHMKPGNN